MIVEGKVLIAAGIPAVILAAVALVQGIVLSTELLLGVGVNFVTLVFLGAKVIADGRSQKHFQDTMRDVPDRLTRIEQDVLHIRKDLDRDERRGQRREGL